MFSLLLTPVHKQYTHKLKCTENYAMYTLLICRVYYQFYITVLSKVKNPLIPKCDQGHSNIYPTRCNITQFIYIWKLLYMFQVVSPPIIMSTHNCIYSIWHLSNRYCYLPLSWNSWNSHDSGSNGSSTGLTSTICCRYSCVCS